MENKRNALYQLFASVLNRPCNLRGRQDKGVRLDKSTREAIVSEHQALASVGMGFPTFPNGMPKTSFMEYLESLLNGGELPPDEAHQIGLDLHKWGCVDGDTLAYEDCGCYPVKEGQA